MAEMLLINPRRRRKASRSAPKRRKASHRRSRARRHNPSLAHSPVRRHRRYRRHNLSHMAHRRHRRRRNPIGGGRGMAGGIMSMLKDALIGGLGAVGMDVLMGQVNKFLPATLQTNPSTIGAGDAVKAGLTAVLGVALSKPTRGLSKKLAVGALTTQVRDLVAMNLPAGMTLGWVSPAKIIPGVSRIGPNVPQIMPSNTRQMGAFMTGQGTPLLNGVSAFMPGAGTPLLSSSARARAREGVRIR